MDFAKMKIVLHDSPVTGLIYGPVGIGKTAFGIGAGVDSDYTVGRDSHFLINVDPGGADFLKCNRATDVMGKPIESTADIEEIFINLYQQKHSIEWVTIDDVSSLDEMFIKEVCDENKVPNLKAIEYGNGGKLAAVKWYLLFKWIEGLQKEKPINFLFIGHTAVGNVNDPMSDSYSRHDLQGEKKSIAIIKKGVDFVGFAHSKTLTKTEDRGFGKTELVPVGKS